MNYHDPVMLSECIDGLAISEEGIYADVTFGGGGHSRAILNKLGSKGKLIAFDQDSDAEINLINDNRLILIKDNFKNMQKHLKQQGLSPVNGILADLGVSSHQFDIAERGFSTRFEHDLDMRMDNSSGITALEILNNWSEKQLVNIFSTYGEIINSKSLASVIVKERSKSKFENSTSLRKAIEHLVPKANASQYLARVYQALRIEVNDEIGALKALLLQSPEILIKGGRMVVMSYHSLEDRLVKNFFNKGNFEGRDDKDIYGRTTGRLFKSITKKPIFPDDEEIKKNPRSRSARLRIAEKL